VIQSESAIVVSPVPFVSFCSSPPPLSLSLSLSRLSPSLSPNRHAISLTALSNSFCRLVASSALSSFPASSPPRRCLHCCAVFEVTSSSSSIIARAKNKQLDLGVPDKYVLQIKNSVRFGSERTFVWPWRAPRVHSRIYTVNAARQGFPNLGSLAARGAASRGPKNSRGAPRRRLDESNGPRTNGAIFFRITQVHRDFGKTKKRKTYNFEDLNNFNVAKNSLRFRRKRDI